MLAVGAACLASSFVFGLQTAGNIQPVSLIEAGGSPVTGDIDRSGTVDLNDVVIILEVVQGYRTPTPEMLQRDPNEDGQLNVDDALRILSTLSLQ